jgi:putative ABC transport system ATP-binding protein
MIRLNAVTKIYDIGISGSHTAVAGITLSLPRKQITVLQGPSGSGKTTLISLIGCMARPTEGRIFFEEKEVTSLPEQFLADLRRRQVGFVFQNYNLIKGISVLENVMLPAMPLGEPDKPLKRRAEELLDQLEITRLAPLPVEHLSGGEQQRVAIARALINRPHLFIADEPTAHLDAALSGQFMAIAADLKDQGKTVIIASHDPLVSTHPAVDRVVTLQDGRLRSRSDTK